MKELSIGEKDRLCNEAANKARVEMEKEVWLNKACEWLKENVEKYYYLDEAYDKVISVKNLIGDFKKNLEGDYNTKRESYPPIGEFHMYPQYDEGNNLVGFTTDYEGEGAYGSYCKIIATGETR